MQDLIIDVNLAHFRLKALTHFLLQGLRLIGLGTLFSQLGDASRLDEVRQLERNLVNAAFVLEIAALLSPMPRNRDRVAHLLTLQEKQGVLGSDIPRFNQVWSLHRDLQLKNPHLLLSLALLLSELLAPFLDLFLLSNNFLGFNSRLLLLHQVLHALICLGCICFCLLLVEFIEDVLEL